MTLYTPTTSNPGYNSLSDVINRLNEIGIEHNDLVRKRRELKELPTILSKNEIIMGIVSGFYEKGNGVLVATNLRLLFIDKGILFGIRIEDFGLDKVTSVQYSSGLMLSNITIQASGNAAKIQHVDKKSGMKFVEIARNLISGNSKPEKITTQEAPDTISQIEKLSKLRDQGIITEQEFLERKTILLNRL